MMNTAQFHIGEWQVDPSDNSVTKGKVKRVVEPRAMDVLLLLCQQHGEVVSSDEIISQCWVNIDVGDNPVHKAITQLRRALNDKATAPQYIETIRKRGYRIIADVDFIYDEQTKAAGASWTQGSPFPGLHAFCEQHADVFYGRASAVDALIHLLKKQLTQRQLLTVILGPSGSGKSSLVNAGLLPRLKDCHGHHGIQVISDTRIDGADVSPCQLFIELAGALLDWEISETPIFEGYSAEQLAKQLQDEPEVLREHFESRLNLLTPNATAPACILIFDRLEAVLSHQHISQAEKELFFHVVDCLSTGTSLLVYLICRNDFYPLLSHYPALIQLKNRGGHFDLLPPSAIEMSQMIRLPAAAAGLLWERDPHTGVGLDDRLCMDAVNHPDGLPLLQYTLQELYLQRQGNTLQLSTYNTLGGVEGAIGVKAESLYASLEAPVQKAFASIMSKLINLSYGNEQLTSRSVQWRSLRSPHERVFVQHMVEQRLFVSHLHQSEACFNVTHEALLRRWQRVQDWVKQHQSALTIKNRLALQTQQWVGDNRSRAFLLSRGKPLVEALELRQDVIIPLTDDEHALIDASVRSVNQKGWLKRGIVVALTCLTLFAFVALINSQQAQSMAERKRKEAENLMGFMIGDFADKLRSVKRMDLLEGISKQALKYVEQSQQDNDQGFFSPSLPPPSFELRFQHALSLQAMAEVRYYRNNVKEAKQFYEEAQTRLTQLLKEAPHHFELLKAAGANAFWLGQIAYDKQDLDTAQQAFSRYTALSNKMVDLYPDNADAQLELSYAYNTLGSVAFEAQNYEQALDYFKQSLVIKKHHLAFLDDTTQAEIYINDTYSWIASTLINLGRLSDAIANIELAEQRARSLYEKNNTNAAVIEAYIYTLERLADYLTLRGNYEKTVSLLLGAKKAVKALLQQDADNSTWNNDNARVTVSLMKALLYANHTSDSVDYGKTLDELERVTSSEDITHTLNLSLAAFYQDENQWAKSKRILNELNHTKETQDSGNGRTNERISTLVLQIRQSHHEGEEVKLQQYCRDLDGVSEVQMTLNANPNYLIANTFAALCLGKQTKSQQMLVQLADQDVTVPPYFSIFNKEK
ncbi:winged helix-turn-helix domain-containing protein [Alteromonas sp. C1M14]|uniref:nSTAND1 domain-containing NTPase n=1 Tax=Alteromonas sp. C1M14 TaxID=2841567 RepID=UPI001C09AAD5|nr:winged helix-turn-helix domain-containing protein [Alteromonas sp. C1M14]MBU2979691.1 winged helix-turn-helix domain-containing protein [Alteromonas sp. C1M14]